MVQVVITTSGLGSRLGDFTKYINKSMLKLGDKFVIDYIIETYISIKDVEFVFTIGYKGEYIKQYINLIYSSKIKYIFVEIDNYDGPGSSLGYSLLNTKNVITGPFYFHCNDSIIYEKIDFESITTNTLFVTKHEDSTQYCSININNNLVHRINNKGENVFDYIYIGVAYIKDHAMFYNLLENEYQADMYNTQLNDITIYKKMLSQHTFLYKYIDKYVDTGNNKQLIHAKKILKGKYEVLDKLTESISFIDNKVAKFFIDKKINQNRVERTKYIPVHLLPQIHGSSDNFFVMSLESGLPLSKVYCKNMVKKLLDFMFSNFWCKAYVDNTFKEKCYDFYKLKTLDRIKLALESDIVIDYHVINKQDIGDIHSLIKKIDFEYLSDGTPTQFHGDFILENILLKNDETYCLVDWRQDFEGLLEYGDMYYDLAKLRHNLQVNHQNVEENLFYINNDTKVKNECTLDMKCNYYLMNELQCFDKYIEQRGLDLKKVKMINSLIWINMSPLHTYPLSNFLFNLGKYSLHNLLCEE